MFRYNNNTTNTHTTNTHTNNNQLNHLASNPWNLWKHAQLTYGILPLNDFATACSMAEHIIYLQTNGYATKGLRRKAITFYNHIVDYVNTTLVKQTRDLLTRNSDIVEIIHTINETTSSGVGLSVAYANYLEAYYAILAEEWKYNTHCLWLLNQPTELVKQYLEVLGQTIEQNC